MSTLGLKRRRDIWRQKWQFVAVLVTVVLGVAMFTGTFNAYLNLGASLDGTYDRLQMADVTVADPVDGFAGDSGLDRRRRDRGRTEPGRGSDGHRRFQLHRPSDRLSRRRRRDAQPTRRRRGHRTRCQRPGWGAGRDARRRRLRTRGRRPVRDLRPGGDGPRDRHLTRIPVAGTRPPERVHPTEVVRRRLRRRLAVRWRRVGARSPARSSFATQMAPTPKQVDAEVTAAATAANASDIQLLADQPSNATINLEIQGIADDGRRAPAARSSLRPAWRSTSSSLVWCSRSVR